MVKYLVKSFLISEPLVILTLSLEHYPYVAKEILAGCDVIIIFFLIYGRFVTIQK